LRRKGRFTGKRAEKKTRMVSRVGARPPEKKKQKEEKKGVPAKGGAKEKKQA